MRLFYSEEKSKRKVEILIIKIAKEYMKYCISFYYYYFLFGKAYLPSSKDMSRQLHFGKISFSYCFQ